MVTGAGSMRRRWSSPLREPIKPMLPQRPKTEQASLFSQVIKMRGSAYFALSFKLFTILLSGIVVSIIRAYGEERSIYMVFMESNPVAFRNGDVAFEHRKGHAPNWPKAHAKQLVDSHDQLLASRLELGTYCKLYSFTHIVNGFAVHTSPSQNALLSRSAKLSRILKDQKQKHQQDLYLPDIPADAKTFELVVDICYGELVLSAGNVIPLACVASYLEMTEDHNLDNLLKTTRSFFNHEVLNDWKESIKAFRSCERVLSEAMDRGLIDSCLLSISNKALSNPHLLGKLIENSFELGDLGRNRPSAMRKLFEADACSEEIFTLPLQLFELAISTMAGRGVPPQHVASCLLLYAKKNTEAGACLHDKSLDREVIEVVERLLPGKVRALPCKYLLKMLRQAILLQASSDCRKGLERRIGKQLQEASVEDLLIPRYGFANETQYDMECVITILKHFYETCSSLDSTGVIQGVETSGMVQVMELINCILSKVSGDPHLKKETFISLAGVVGVTLNEMGRSTDNLYSIIDVYLCAHGHLDETEREEVCQVLDIQKMSVTAHADAVQNERLPLRIAVQVLFVGQLRLQETIERLPESEFGSRDEEEKEKVEENGEDEKVREEMERMDSRVLELERECDRMKRGIEREGRKKQSLWKEMKRKLGCSIALYYSNCQVKKIHPKDAQNG